MSDPVTEIKRQLKELEDELKGARERVRVMSRYYYLLDQCFPDVEDGERSDDEMIRIFGERIDELRDDREHLKDRVDKLENRDWYSLFTDLQKDYGILKKAKEENDERFILERDEARARAEKAERAIDRAFSRLKNPDMGGTYVGLARDILDDARRGRASPSPAPEAK